MAIKILFTDIILLLMYKEKGKNVDSVWPFSGKILNILLLSKPKFLNLKQHQTLPSIS
jgi:hypothetical protein